MDIQIDEQMNRRIDGYTDKHCIDRWIARFS